jgi:hypothetical protein
MQERVGIAGFGTSVLRQFFVFDVYIFHSDTVKMKQVLS